MLQVATPYVNDEDIEGSLDIWVRRIMERYPQKNVTWLSGGKSKKAAEQAAALTPPAPTGPDLSMYNIPELKKQLIDFGLPESMCNLLTDADIVENARVMGLLDKKPETPPDTSSETMPTEPPPAKPDEHPDAKGKKKKGG